jgi:hypothetical protein
MKILGYEITIKKIVPKKVFVETPESLYGHIETLARIKEGWIELEATKGVYAGLKKLAEEDFKNDLDVSDVYEEGESYYEFEILKTVGNTVYFRVH